MASVLHFMGYGPVESLQQFLSRFTLPDTVIMSYEEELSNVWIGHKNDQAISKFTNTMNKHNFDLHYHNNHTTPIYQTSFNAKDSLQNKFNSSLILGKIFNKLHCCMADYIITDCLILYNWGFDSLELIIENEEFSSKLMCLDLGKVDKRCIKYEDTLKNYIKWRHILWNSKENKEKRRKYLLNKSTDVGRRRGDKTRPRKKNHKNIMSLIDLERSRPSLIVTKSVGDPCQETFNKNKILYNLRQRRWPKNHPLALPCINDLLKVIFTTKNVKNSKFSSSELLDETLKSTKLKRILSYLVKTHQTVANFDGYGRILKHHLKKAGFGLNCSKRRLEPIPKKVVSSFIIDILRKMLPISFFGKNRSRKQFFNQIIRIISGSKHEDFIFEPIVQIFTESDADWLREIPDSKYRKAISCKLLKWLLLDYIFVILKIYFYITEVGSSGYRLYYFRKGDIDRAISNWVKFQMSVRNLELINGNLKHWNSLERIWIETGRINERRKLKYIEMPKTTKYIQPVANVRFVPKTAVNGELRIITNFATKKTVLCGESCNNQKLFEMFFKRRVKTEVLVRKVKYLLDFLVDRYGTGMKSVPNNPKLHMAWNRAVKLKEIYSKLYFVKADITNAFGSISQTMLSKIIGDKLNSDNIEKMQLIKLEECRMRKGKVEITVRRGFSDRPKENSFLISRTFRVGRNMKLPSFNAKELKEILDQIIFHQYLRIDSKVYRFSNGLAQGSAVSFSPLLCEIYYSEMDRLYFGEFLTSEECILVRGVDDYLLITSQIEKALKFYDIICSGIKEFNVTFGKGKLCTNINEGIPRVNYLGLTFDLEDMSVRPDYSKFSNTDILSTMRLSDPFCGKFFKRIHFLQFRSLLFLPLKLYPITLSSVNDIGVIKEIIYGASLFQANRILTLTRYLFHSYEKNDLDISVVLSKSVRKILHMICRMRQDIRKDDIIWIFWNACLTVFRMHSGSFPFLLTVIRLRISIVEKRIRKKGNEMVLERMKSEIKCRKPFRELRRIFKMITQKSKPSHRLSATE